MNIISISFDCIRARRLHCMALKVLIEMFILKNLLTGGKIMREAKNRILGDRRCLGCPVTVPSGMMYVNTLSPFDM